MKLKLVICVVLAILASCTSKQHLRRSRRKAARDRIPYSSLSAGVIPSRVRSRLRARGRQSTESGASRSDSDSGVVTNSDASSGSYSSNPSSPQYGYPANGNQYGSQQQYSSQQSGARQRVPVGASTFPYATSGIYSGPSQNRYSSQQLPIPSTYRGGQAGYRTQQPSQYPSPVSQYPPPVQQSYYSQQQYPRPGYASGYPSQGNPYGGMSYGNPRIPQTQYPYGSYGQQPSYGGGGYAGDSYTPLGAIGSAYRDPYSRFTSYIHPQAEVGNGYSNPYGGSDSYYGSSQYGSDAGSNYYGGSSSYQSSNVPSPGAYGASGYGQQDQQSSSNYGYGSSNAQSGVPSSGARDYGQSQDNQNPYGTSGGNQYGYGSDASNSFGTGSQSAYDDTSYGQGNQYGGSYGSSMQGSISGAQSSNYPDSSGTGRTGAGISGSSRSQYGGASSMQPSSRYSSQQLPSDSRVQSPTRNMHDSGSSSYSRYFQTGQDDSSRNTESQRTSARYINPGSTDAPTTTSRSSNSGRRYQTGQRNPSAGLSPVFQQRNGGRVVTFSGTGSQDEPRGPLSPTRGSHVISPVYQQRNDTNGAITFHGSRRQYEQSGTYLVGSRGGGISLPGVAMSTEVSTTTPAPPTPDTVGSLSRCQSKNNGLPDLALYPSDFKKDGSIFLDTRRRDEILCAVNENCLSKLHPRLSSRLLLRFPTIVHNVGTADFRPDLPPQDWIYHTCHRHYHSMQEFAHFYLYDKNGTVVGEGHKVSFCLQDSGCNNPCKPKYNCSGATERDRPTQAISPGCYDDYLASLDCQWIDITSIPTNSKDYTLKIIVNPAVDGERAVPEFSYTNNAVACKITLISNTKLVVGRCYQV